MNQALKRFHEENCPDLSYDDPRLTSMLIEKINELKSEGIDLNAKKSL